MVKTLRKRPRPDQLKTQQRRATNSAGRRLYLLLLLAFGVTVLNYLVGDFVLLRADGLVLRDKTSVATTYVARVAAIDVEGGQSVRAGAQLLRLQSTHMLERLADLSADRARLAAKAAEFKIRSETVAHLLPLAVKREQQSTKVLSKLDRMSSLQLVTSARHYQALGSQYEARQALVRLKAESSALKEELAALAAARADADRALADLRSHYADGVVRAATAGSIGASVPAVGDVFRPGETILSIYSGDAYVLAYLPRRYLFPIRPGKTVHVSAGRLSTVGVIRQILPVTDALPKEFQNTFKPRDRGQLARIQVTAPSPFPLHEKVEITSHFGWVERVADLFQSARDRLNGR